MNRARKRGNKDKNKKRNGALKNEVFDYNNELTENPLYITSQPAEEMGNISGEKHELGLPNNRPIDPLSVYAVPNKNKSLHQMTTNSRDVYAQVYKWNVNTAKDHVNVQIQTQDSVGHKEV